MTNKIDSFENQIFSWEEWEEISTMCFQFENVVLKIPVGEFKIGERFERVFIDYENSMINLYPTNNGKEYAYMLHPVIGERFHMDEEGNFLADFARAIGQACYCELLCRFTSAQYKATSADATQEDQSIYYALQLAVDEYRQLGFSTKGY